MTKPPDNGSGNGPANGDISTKSAAVRTDFQRIADGLREELKRAEIRMYQVDETLGWASGLLSAHLAGDIALPLDRFLDVLREVDTTPEDFFARVYADDVAQLLCDEAELEGPLAEALKSDVSASGMGTTPFRIGPRIPFSLQLLSTELRRAIREAGTFQAGVEERVGWTPRYLSTLLAGRRPLKLQHIFAVLRAIELSPAAFWLAGPSPPEKLKATSATGC